MAKICKFQIEKRQVSYDCGEMWEDTGETRKIEGQEPVERYSYDCGWSDSFLYRWVETTDESVCVGYHKYSKKYQEVSFNQGVDWEIVEGSEQPGTLMEKFSSACCQLRTVTADTCDELFRYVNASIEEASLDGETWVQTGRYTVNNVISAVSQSCMDANDVKYIIVPISGVSGNSVFDYNEYSECSDAYDAHGCNSGYTIVQCDCECGCDKDAVDVVQFVYYDITKEQGVYFGECSDISSTVETYEGEVKVIHIDSGETGTLGGFSGCTGLTEIDGLGNSKISEIVDYAFSGCTSLTEVTLPSTCVVIGGNAFKGCTSLTSVTINSDHLLRGDAQAYYGQFSGCTSLQTVTFPNDYSGIIYKEMFNSCTSLTSVTLGNPTSIYTGAFGDCSSLTVIDLGNKLKVINIDAFAGCTNLTDIYVESTEDVSLSYPQCIFPSGTTIHVPCEKYDYWRSQVPSTNPVAVLDTSCRETRWVESGTTCVGYDLYTRAIEEERYGSGGTWYITGNESATTLIEANSVQCGFIPSTYTLRGVDSEGNQTFVTCSESDIASAPSSSIVEAYVGDCATSLGSFDNCTSLSSLTYDTSVAYEASGLSFRNCYNLSSVIDLTNVTGLTSVGTYMFSNCDKLTKVVMPASVTYIDDYGFNNGAVFELVLPYDGVVGLGSRYPLPVRGGSFVTLRVPANRVNDYKANSKYSSYISNDLMMIMPIGVDTTKLHATYSDSTEYSADCDGANLTTATTKPSGYQYTAMTSAEIGNCVRTIGRNAFQNCTSLTSVTIPSGVTYIGFYAFYGCSSLESVVIPSGVTTIGDRAFEYCTGLTSITMERETPPNLEYASDCPTYVFDYTGDCPICVPSGSVNTYKNASYWSKYASRIMDCSIPPVPPNYFKFIARESGTFTFTSKNAATANTLSYSLDNGSTWASLANGVASPTVASGSTILWKCSNPTSSTSTGIGTFSSTGAFDVEGNVMSLLYGDDYEDKTSLSGKNYVFYGLFSGCTGVVNAGNMVLPATRLSERCYSSMFYNCTSLVTAPELPAMRLENSCYMSMFAYCTSLTTSPVLSAYTLSELCYCTMFYGCTSMNTVTCLATDKSANNCTLSWLESVASTGTFYRSPGASWERGWKGVPYDWTIQNAT